jgi:molybdopterin synthase sulfur carrier subunit
MIDVFYFAWVRERIGTAARTGRDPGRDGGRSGGRTVGAREDRYALAFADLDQRCAWRWIRTWLDFDAPLAGVREVAFFPPMTGG